MTDEQFQEIRTLLRHLNLSMATTVALLSAIGGDKKMSADVAKALEDMIDRFEKAN